MFSKLPVAIASASLLSVQARTLNQKQKAVKKWPQEIDNEWTSHPNFPEGPYGHVYEGQIAHGKRWPQTIDDEWTSHPNFPTGPYGDVHEGFAQVKKGNRWPQAIDNEWTSHPNFPSGPYGDAHEGFAQVNRRNSFSQMPPMTNQRVSVDDVEEQKPVLGQKGKKSKQDPPEYEDSWTPHPNFPTGPYGPAHDLHDPNAPGPSYPYPPGGYPNERISSAGEYIRVKPAFAKKPSDPNCNSADGCLTDTSDPFTKQSDLGYDIDYPVVDLGMDHDIIATHKHMTDAEDRLGPWVLPPPALVQKPSIPACTSFECQTDTADPYTQRATFEDYTVPNYGMDEDIVHSMKHMNDAESQHGPWVLPNSLVELNSDPIVDSADSYAPHMPGDYRAPAYDMDYFVPDFGVDEDIANTQAHEAAAGEALGHTWTPVFDEEEEKWIVPTEDPFFKLLQLDSDPHLQTYDDRTWMDRHYTDEGVNDIENEAMYNFAPTLDEHILDSQKNLADQEDLKMHKFTPWD